MLRRSVLASSVLVLTAAALLTGCTFSASNLAVLDTDRVAADELPSLEAHAYESVDESSSRFVGEHDGLSLWVAAGTESPACLVAVAEDDNWILSCGGLPIRMSGVGHTFELRPDGAPAPDGMTRISDNVFVG